ncbi:hypothetical protein G3N56_07525 [Desulfovibrio sulfodismutans]|uniref:ABC transporter substrate-binding protein n=1 Tax=Desulfolutivibrio sulfodismutans TaxID=63561 RepID=A0A7K3NK87_9BACT|nr:ABC transporter substrate binding protein [Desulfolutivibrio sulfodismutans]NDY56592.1 hypothetical protein [Desulfolutivibrio sulfodismutans]QLA13050.1 hypothetical protein GD606_12625 [Desulfolutivibrio sulfodismutans DSM 3696]
MAAATLAAAWAAVWAVAAQDELQRRVIVVQSYNPEYVWCREIDAGIREALAGTGATIETLYLDAKRRPDPASLRAAADTALARIQAATPQVVIAVDDAAQASLTVPFLKDRPTPQVVFCGVNAPLATYGFPAPNVTGVRERYHFREGFALIKKIVPQAKSVAIFGEDSESMRFVVEDLNQIIPFALEIAGVEICRTFQEWRQKVAWYQSRADVYAFGPYNALTDERTGRIVPPDEVMAWTVAAAAKPTLGFSDIAKEHGMLCGILESGREQGRVAGEMARHILDTGTTAGSMPVRINVEGVVMVNLRTAERLGVRIPFPIIEAAGVVLQ